MVVNDNGNIKVYLNNEQVVSGTNFPDVFSGAAGAGFWIGVNHCDPAYQGSIDELAFLTRH